MLDKLPRPEYPRPDFEREQWLNLNGEWEFGFDDRDVGEQEAWYEKGKLPEKIIVPFCYQSKMSGIESKQMHEILWYRRDFDLPEGFADQRVFLNFGAVDYEAKVWVNGKLAGGHIGGHTPFKIDITDFLNKGSNSLAVKVIDRYECVQPRGKQYWKRQPDRCWYTPTSGIWQTVWLEATGAAYIDKVLTTPDIDSRNVVFEVYLNKALESAVLSLEISYGGNLKKKLDVTISERITKITVDIKEEDFIDEIHYWSPETPNLYDVLFKLSVDNRVTDTVKSYFGMRKISVEGDNILLNNTVYYQKLVLDQGYWPESLLTPPSDEAIQYDIKMTKEMGFNGVRKHQKIEDPRYYYWADKYGLLVWGEMPSAYDFNSEQISNVMREMTEFVLRDYNHPCIITWVPLNESWGVRNILRDKKQQSFGRALYHMIKSLDGSRLVSTNDGWEQVESDICAIHDYVAAKEDFLSIYGEKEKTFSEHRRGHRLLYVEGVKYNGQPVLFTEYGGIAIDTGKSGEWGYFGAVKSEAEFLERYKKITEALVETSYIRGYCYTQLTDVMQEVNGLMTADRKMKVDVEKVRKINQII